MIEPTTHIHVLSQSLQVLRELLEIPNEQWDEWTLLRADAHLHAIKTSSEALKDWCAAKEFVRKLEQA